MKVAFAVSAAIDASLIAWLVQNHDAEQPVVILFALVAALALAILIVSMNLLAYRRIRELKALG